MSKILIISPYFYPEGGGLENYAYHVAQAMPEHDFISLSLTQSRESCSQLGRIKVIRKRANFSLSNTPLRWSFYWDILKLIKQEKITLIHAHTPVPFAADMAALVSFFTKTPLILTYHNGGFRKGIWWLDILGVIYEIFEKFALRQAKKIVVVSPHILKQKKFQAYSVKTQVVTPGVELKNFPEQNYFPQNQKLLTVINLQKNYPHKGLSCLLRALVAVKEKIPLVNLMIAGNKGDAYQDYHDQAKVLGLEKNVEFLGRLNLEGMRQAYIESICTLIPSLSDTEGCPVVLFEAGASSRAVIGARVGGIPEIIKDGENGWLVAPNDPQSLAEKIIAILQNPDFAQLMGRQARKIIRDKYDWQILVKQYQEIYKNII